MWVPILNHTVCPTDPWNSETAYDKLFVIAGKVSSGTQVIKSRKKGWLNQPAIKTWLRNTTSQEAAFIQKIVSLQGLALKRARGRRGALSSQVGSTCKLFAPVLLEPVIPLYQVLNHQFRPWPNCSPTCTNSDVHSVSDYPELFWIWNMNQRIGLSFYWTKLLKTITNHQNNEDPQWKKYKNSNKKIK